MHAAVSLAELDAVLSDPAAASQAGRPAAVPAPSLADLENMDTQELIAALLQRDDLSDLEAVLLDRLIRATAN